MNTELPKDWRAMRLGDVAFLRKEKSLPTEDDERIYLGLEHISVGGSLNGHGRAGDALSQKAVFFAGDTLYGKLRPNLRKAIRARFDGVCSTDILVLVALPDEDDSFVSHLLQSGQFHVYALRGVTGTRMPRTSWSHLKGYRFLLPPLAEQRAIAEVLDSIDEAIERTEALIAATENLRESLSHELLTRGIPGRHSEYKEVPRFGDIPSDWKSVRLGDVADIAFSGVDKKSVQGELPVRLCNYTDVFYNRRILPDFVFMSATATPAEVQKWTLRKGDVLFTKDSETSSEIGIPSFVAEDMPGVLCGYHLGRARPRSGIEGSYLAFALSSVSVAREFSRVANGITRFGLTLGSTCAIHILLPPLAEQRAIAAVLDSIEESIEYLKGDLDARVEVKKSVADALLTGRVRVNTQSEMSA